MGGYLGCRAKTRTHPARATGGRFVRRKLRATHGRAHYKAVALGCVILTPTTRGRPSHLQASRVTPVEATARAREWLRACFASGRLCAGSWP